MEKTKRKKSRKARLTQLAQTLVRCAIPDVYLPQAERLQQANLPTSQPDYACIAPEQIIALARIERYNAFTHRSRS
jgi:hypothetical protein